MGDFHIEVPDAGVSWLVFIGLDEGWEGGRLNLDALRNCCTDTCSAGLDVNPDFQHFTVHTCGVHFPIRTSYRS